MSAQLYISFDKRIPDLFICLQTAPPSASPLPSSYHARGNAASAEFLDLIVQLTSLELTTDEDQSENGSSATAKFFLIHIWSQASPSIRNIVATS